MGISTAGLKVIEEFEGCRLAAYQDSVGVWTIGFGTTAGAGVDVRPGMTCSLETAQSWLATNVHRSIEPALDAAIKAAPRQPNPHQYDALCSLGYNLGSGVFGTSYQIGRDLRAGNLEAVSADFLRYVYAGGHVLQGLVNRRKAEQALFNKPYVPPYSYADFDTAPRHLWGERVFNEREVAQEYDRKRQHPVVFAKRLAVLRKASAAFVDRLNEVMAVDPAHTDALHRHWRVNQLRARSLGQVVVK